MSNWKYVESYRKCAVFVSKRSGYYGVSINGLWVSPFTTIGSAKTQIDKAWKNEKF